MANSKNHREMRFLEFSGCILLAALGSSATEQARIALETDVAPSRPAGWQKVTGLSAAPQDSQWLELTFAVKQNNTAALFELLEKTSDPGDL